MRYFIYFEKEGVFFYFLRYTYVVCGFDMLVYNFYIMFLDFINKCYVMGILLRCENEICKFEIIWKKGEVGKKGVFD